MVVFCIVLKPCHVVRELVGIGVPAITNQPQVLAFAPCPSPRWPFRWTGQWGFSSSGQYLPEAFQQHAKE